jgi:hypothetical protein
MVGAYKKLRAGHYPAHPFPLATAASEDPHLLLGFGVLAGLAKVVARSVLSSAIATALYSV